MVETQPTSNMSSSLGLVLAGGLLRDQHDLPLGFHRRLERLDGLGPTDEQRDDHVREHDHVAQRQQRQVDRLGGRQEGMSGHVEYLSLLVPNVAAARASILKDRRREAGR